MVQKSEKEVLEIISQALNVQSGPITEASSAKTLPEWDSLGHLGLLVALDKAFENKVAGIKEMATADSIAKILALLRQNGLVK